jgi:cysteine desulfurase/selenocysteine lyase
MTEFQQQEVEFYREEAVRQEAGIAGASIRDRRRSKAAVRSFQGVARSIVKADDGPLAGWPENIDRLRETEFPITKSWAYLNHAATGPLPASHVRAAHQFLGEMAATRPPTSLRDYERQADEVRRLAAELFSCLPSDVALLSSTTEALALVPLGLDWRTGDEVILYEREFPSVVYPWLQLRKKGVRIRFVPDRGNRFELDELIDLVTDRTRVVSVSLVNFVSGFRAPVEAIGRVCKARGIWLLVDAVQAAGVIPVSPEELGADVLAAHGYKHLLSGYAVALCYCSERARAELAIPAPGWVGTSQFTRNDDVLNYEATTFSSDARRFEPSVPSFSGLWGAAESLRLIVEAGPDRIKQHVLGLLDDLIEELRDRGYVIHSPLAPAERSSLLSVSPAGEIDYAAVREGLEERCVSVSLRQGALRVSPHLYNTRDDVERLLAALP